MELSGSSNSIKRYPVPSATVENPCVTEMIVRKSRFLTRSARCASAAEARKFALSSRSLFPQASHNCWAFVAGPPGSDADIGCSDDGEPHGTAGRPMLNALLGCGVGEICAVVTRWFGGIKLGTGGLARAYQASVMENLASLPIMENVPMSRLQISLPYSGVDYFHKLLSDAGGKTESENYEACASFIINIPDDRIQFFSDSINRLSNGAAVVSLFSQ